MLGHYTGVIPGRGALAPRKLPDVSRVSEAPPQGGQPFVHLGSSQHQGHQGHMGETAWRGGPSRSPSTTGQMSSLAQKILVSPPMFLSLHLVPREDRHYMRHWELYCREEGDRDACVKDNQVGGNQVGQV